MAYLEGYDTGVVLQKQVYMEFLGKKRTSYLP